MGRHGFRHRKPAWFRQQARDWLQAELTDWTKQAQRTQPPDRAAIRQALRVWQRDAGLEEVRETAALAQLPAAERGGVADILAGCGGCPDRSECSRRLGGEKFQRRQHTTNPDAQQYVFNVYNHADPAAVGFSPLSPETAERGERNGPAAL